MAPLSVAEQFDDVEDVRTGVPPRVADPALDPFALEQLQEALDHRVVVAVAAQPHAVEQVVTLGERLPLVSSELAPLTGMNQHLLLRTPTLQGYRQGIEHQSSLDAL